VAKEYQCDSCGAPLSKSGYYAAKKRGHCRTCKPKKETSRGAAEGSPSHSTTAEGVGSFAHAPDPNPPPVEENESITVEEGPAWMDFDFTEGEESTENIPTALKMLSSFFPSTGPSCKFLEVHPTRLPHAHPRSAVLHHPGAAVPCQVVVQVSCFCLLLC